MAKKQTDEAAHPAQPDGATATGTPGADQGGTGQEPADRKRRKTRVGMVTGDKSAKTVTVSVERRVAHPVYGKLMTRTRKYHAHDEKDEYRVGDVVRIVETRPLSKTKRWRVAELLERPE